MQRPYRAIPLDQPIETGEFVYGCHLFDNSYGENRSTHLIFPSEKIAEMTTTLFSPEKGEIKRFTGDCYKVHPSTVGQAVGLQDKNKVEIYEGDKTNRGIVEWLETRLMWVLNIGGDCGDCFVSLASFNDLEVLGDIHHPALLEGGKK